MPTVALDAKVTRSDLEGKSHLSVTLHNSGTQVALMAHLQVRRKRSGERVLPVYYSDNYVSLLPNESKEITIEVATSDLQGDDALVLVDGWNVGVNVASSAGIGIAPNADSRVDHWPVTGLPIITN